MGLHGKGIWRTLLSNGVNPHDIHQRTTTVLKKVIPAKNCQLALTVKQAGQNERGLSDSQNPRSRKEDDKITQMQTCVTTQEKEM